MSSIAARFLVTFLTTKSFFFEPSRWRTPLDAFFFLSLIFFFKKILHFLLFFFDVFHCCLFSLDFFDSLDFFHFLFLFIFLFFFFACVTFHLLFLFI